VQDKPHVLIVDDDPDTLAAVATDVVVLDSDLGPGMRGDQFAAEYRRRAKRSPRIVVLSGVRAAYEIARGMGAAAIFPKPYDAGELVTDASHHRAKLGLSRR